MIAASHSIFVKTFISLLCAAALCGSVVTVRASDHGDAPNLAGDEGADLADLYFFLDPNDNSKAVIIGTVHGFIVPGEAVNFAIFDPTVRFRFEFENTGGVAPNFFIDVSFDRRFANPGPPGKEILQVPRAQTATVRLPGQRQFSAPVLNPSLSGNPPDQASAITRNAGGTGVDFFAGETDDPFFFDLPAFGRFIASVRDGHPDPTQFNRGRDTFAGYNVLAIAMRVPVAMIRGSGNVIGLDVRTQRRTGDGPFQTIDRVGNPGVNVALVPFNRKNE